MIKEENETGRLHFDDSSFELALLLNAFSDKEAAYKEVFRKQMKR